MTAEWLASSIRVKFLILLITVLLIVLMMPRGEAIEFEVSVGSVWLQEDLNAEFTFEVLKDDAQYRKEVSAKARSVLPVYLFDESVPAKIKDTLEQFHAKLTETLEKAIASKSPLPESDLPLSEEAFEYAKTLRAREHDIHGLPENHLREVKRAVQARLETWYARGVIDTRARIDHDSINVLIRNIEATEPAAKFNTVLELRDKVLRNKEITQNQFDRLVNEYALRLLVPNIIYQPKMTNDEVNHAMQRVSRYAGIVNEGERIVGKHDPINSETKLKIDSYRQKKGERMGALKLVLQLIGKFLHIFSLLLLFGIYLFLFRKKIFSNNKTLVLFAVMLLWISFVAFIINYLHLTSSLRFLVFLPAASMLITIIFDSRVGFYATVVFSLVLGALMGNDYPYVVMNIFAGALSVYTVRDIKNRTQIFRSFLYILIGYSASIIAFGLERFASIEMVGPELGVAATNALISPVLTYGLLIFFERMFKITTDLTLLELSNFDKPLLRELAKKAPGTFNHSISMGNLAENAAIAIQANSLLARVGAYYHDIGKLITPKYFVENQTDQTNIHNELTPAESARLIRDHVQLGIEIAKKDNLPQEIIDFIPMHHGKSVMTFFYEKAKTLYGEENVSIDDYRYPGPKPNTKETAIVMLADSCESAVKSIVDPEPERVTNLISNLIESRIEDGQLNETPLTFGDIMKIKSAFLEALIGQHHHRIRYPQQEAMERKDD